MPTVHHRHWGTTPAGPANLYTLTNRRGNQVAISDYGATVTSIQIGGAEMVIGFDALADYLGEQPYYGALVGRYGNRIANGQFQLGGKTYTLATNDKGNQLHGGPRGFDKCIWSANARTTNAAAVLECDLVSPAGDQGFPGTLSVRCTYAWTDENELRIAYRATTTEDTIVNLTNHSYFNIGSAPTVLEQVLQLAADHYVPVNDRLIPTGSLADVAGSPFDFRSPKAVGKDIKADHPQVQLANGYDHTFAVRGYDGSLREFALLTDPATGRSLRCFTTEPGVQLFTANFAPGQFRQRGGEALPTYGAICLETQHFPDSPNQAAFQTPLLRVGETYATETVYRFE
ncbi:aldose epimerase family protein [Neolewinella lacunae]|uniref:Aldose 1-epimerase n=1 Tax=Neolewinella lacunae TaxID=1517758 RepID=A0A923PPP8_9BACT|nr:aldose epimerase family protein [Neolewinella lacunae]MBC6994432.1 galactose mutarotase [Neolewinella lacunae]MDN3633368.1 aldose epimerase family protein [Neolewinella lacunae]